MIIREALSEADLIAAHPVVHELRPHLDLSAFLAAVVRQRTQGYRLFMVEAEDQVKAIAGWRLVDTLAWGRILYVDDLVSRAEERGKGYGSALMDWLIAEARRQGCAELHLDSGVQRHGAHRFYLHKGMDITSHHFGMKLHPQGSASEPVHSQP